MARLAVDGPGPAPQSSVELQLQDLAVLVLVVCAAVAVANPGIAAGGVVAFGWRWLHRPAVWQRLLCAAIVVAPLLVLHSFIVWGWPWHDWLAHVVPTMKIPAANGQEATRSFYAEALIGPAWCEAVMFAVRLRSRRVDALVRREHRLDQRRWRAISGRRQPMVPDPHTPTVDRTQAHPDGAIRLGVDAETNRPLDLELPRDLAAHVFLPGASGSGKTTTVARLADGALANGYSVVIVDAKAGGLGGTARQLAKQYGVPFYLVDPDGPKTLGYNPCTGDPSAVANKIVGAFSYGPTAEIYKSIAMEAVPLVVRGLQEVGKPVTLEALHDAFGPSGMENIARELPEDSRTSQRLFDFAESQSKDRAGSGGRGGLRYRLGALLEGKFGELFRMSKVLDWDKATSKPSVVYIALSALASSEDVELFARVIAQDEKQVAARRLRQLDSGTELVPVLTVFDEFAALNEAEQLVDFLLQARQAEMPTVISTQYLPETFALRQACLGAGLLIVHRVAAEDAEAIAAQFGTRRATDVTHQIDYASGYSEKGSIRRVDRYQVNPNELREFTAGQAAVKMVPRRRYTIATMPRRTERGEWEWPIARK
jgi:hypothetical protein